MKFREDIFFSYTQQLKLSFFPPIFALFLSLFQGSELECDHMDPPGRLCLATVLDETVSEHMPVAKSLLPPNKRHLVLPL